MKTRPGRSPRVVDLGTRVELVSMDSHFHDISVSLYRQLGVDGTLEFVVHTYSGRPGAGARIGQIAAAMRVLGGLPEGSAPGRLRFGCGAGHDFAVRRLFLEACKADPAVPVQARDLSTEDRKTGLTIALSSVGHGQYRVAARGEGDDEVRSTRVGVIVNGLLKLGEMRRVEGGQDCVGFECGCAHDELVGLLLARAPNVRALVREQEAMAARGVLAAPSQQGSR